MLHVRGCGVLVALVLVAGCGGSSDCLQVCASATPVAGERDVSDSDNLSILLARYDSFLAAARAGDVDAFLRKLDPEQSALIGRAKGSSGEVTSAMLRKAQLPDPGDYEFVRLLEGVGEADSSARAVAVFVRGLGGVTGSALAICFVSVDGEWRVGPRVLMRLDSDATREGLVTEIMSLPGAEGWLARKP